MMCSYRIQLLCVLLGPLVFRKLALSWETKLPVEASILLVKDEHY